MVRIHCFIRPKFNIYKAIQIDWLEQQNRLLNQENQRLESELTAKTQELKQVPSSESKNTAGPSTQRVWVHFKDNRLSRAREAKAGELVQLRTENRDLKVAIEKGEFASEDMVHRSEVETLEEKLKHADVMENRLKESFSKRITEFREVINIFNLFIYTVYPRIVAGVIINFHPLMKNYISDVRLFNE